MYKVGVGTDEPHAQIKFLKWEIKAFKVTLKQKTEMKLKPKIDF